VVFRIEAIVPEDRTTSKVKNVCMWIAPSPCCVSLATVVT
jgi:hypothetical protein